jgi:hypothetical protein
MDLLIPAIGLAVFIAFAAGFAWLFRKEMRAAGAWGTIGWWILVMVLSAAATVMVAIGSCFAAISISKAH